MVGEWQCLSLRKAGVTLIDCDHRTPPPTDTGYPYVAIPQLRDGHIDFLGARRITGEHYAEWTKRTKPTANDVILSRRCNPGEKAFVPPGAEFAVGQNLVLLRADGKTIHPPFVRWLVRGPEWWGQIRRFLNVGAVFDSLKCADVPNFELTIPPFPEQRAIAHILGALDDKIELNRRMNATLEAMARALFKSWFVDFDPVHTKLALSGAEGAEGRDTGLPAEIAGLFPDGFEESAVGEAPAGWHLGMLNDFASLNPESWSRATRPALIRYVDLTNTKWGRIEAITEYAQQDAPSRAQRVLRPGDTIIGTVRPGNGSFAYVSEDGLTGSTGFAVLRPRKAQYQEFVYLAATTGDSIGMLAHLADGGAYPAVRPEIVASTQVVCPTDAILLVFARIRTSVQSRTLAALRDALLPKLISGAVRVGDVERFVGAAA